MAAKIRICIVTCIIFFIAHLSFVQAAEVCREWAAHACETLGAKMISCGYEGPGLTAKGLVLDSSILESQGFYLYEGSYFVTVYRIDDDRYQIRLQSVANPDDYQEHIIKPDKMIESYVPDQRPRGPYGHYYWNAAIQYDLLLQIGLCPSGLLPAKMMKQTDVVAVVPEFARYQGFSWIKKGQELSLKYISQDRWHIIDPKTGKGLAMSYQGASWTVLGSIASPAATTSRKTADAVSSNLLFENSDFEYGNLTNWQAEGGDAFLSQPTKGDNVLARRRGNSNHAGQYWIGTHEKYNNSTGTRPGQVQGDRPMGTLISLPFVIKNDRITFLVGGGRRISSLYAALVVDDREVLKTTGFNSEKMRPVTWDVSRFKNKTAQIRIQDQSLQAFGHINVDDFKYSAAPDEPAAATAKPIVLKPLKRTVPATQSAPAEKPDTDQTADTDTLPPASEETPEPDITENSYDGWFPFPEYGWNALPAQERSAGGSLLEVKKTYTRIQDQAVLTIRVKKDKTQSGTASEAGSQNQDPLQGLFGTILGEVLKDMNEPDSGSAGSTISHQGVEGTLKQNGNTVTLSFKNSGYQITVHLNRNESDTAQAYLQMLDFGTLSEVF